MEILLIHLGSVAECFIATSLFKRWKKDYADKGFRVTALVKDQKSKAVFKYNPYVKNCYDIKNIPNDFWDRHYDLALNLNVDFALHDMVNANEYLGLGYHKKAVPFYDILQGGKRTRKSLFQIYYNLAAYTWKGESYFFKYYPRTKNKSYRTAVAVVNKNLSNYISDKLQLSLSNTTYLPNKKNTFKMLDELNKCSNVVTDDFLTLNLATYLKKHVFFLKTRPYNFQLELFGKGKVIKIQPSVIF
jgi:hypothetical protein